MGVVTKHLQRLKAREPTLRETLGFLDFTSSQHSSVPVKPLEGVKTAARSQVHRLPYPHGPGHRLLGSELWDRPTNQQRHRRIRTGPVVALSNSGLLDQAWPGPRRLQEQGIVFKPRAQPRRPWIWLLSPPLSTPTSFKGLIVARAWRRRACPPLSRLRRP